jgi:hemerythrin
MEKLNWKDEYSVGVEKFDRQHKHLLEIVNKLIEQQDASANQNLVSEILTEMLNYAREHFSDEEELMQEYGYQETEPQKKQHAYFLKTTAELSIHALNDKQSLPADILKFLGSWWIIHILKWDMKYKEFFKQKLSKHKSAAV